MGMIENVRIFFEQMGTSTPSAAARALAIDGEQASYAVRELKERGWLKKVEGKRGIYTYHKLKDHEHGRAVKVQETIWRAIRIAKVFTYWDIALYSGANLFYVRKYVRYLAGLGMVTNIGKDGSREQYRCQDQPRMETPVMRSKVNATAIKYEDLENIGWQMMRAFRDGKIDLARDLCKQLEEEFSK